MRRVIAANDFERAIDDPFKDGFAIAGRAQRRVHLEVRVVCRPLRALCGVVTRNLLPVRPPEIFSLPAMATSVKVKWWGARLLLRSARRGVLASRISFTLPEVLICWQCTRAPVISASRMFAHDHHFFAGCRPAAQTEGSAPVPFVHNAICHQRIILAMIHHWQIEHFLRIRGRAAIISLFCTQWPSSVMATTPARFKGPDWRQLLPGDAFRDRAGDEHVHCSQFCGAFVNEARRFPELSIVGDVFGMQTTEVNPPRAAAASAGSNRFLGSLAGLAQNAHVDRSIPGKQSDPRRPFAPHRQAPGSPHSSPTARNFASDDEAGRLFDRRELAGSMTRPPARSSEFIAGQPTLSSLNFKACSSGREFRFAKMPFELTTFLGGLVSIPARGL